MLDQLIIDSTASYDDYEASLAERAIGTPKKKEIKETVPFSNKTHDFSKINGELYWEERELTYIFEIFGDDPADLEHKKTAFANWMHNIMDANIYDPYEPDFHFVGTFSDMEFDDDESIEKTTATVNFMAYPYKIANDATNYVFGIPAGETRAVEVHNDSGHRIVPIVDTIAAITIEKGGVSYAFQAGKSSDSIFDLEAGKNMLEITAPTEGIPDVPTIMEQEASRARIPVAKILEGDVIVYRSCVANADETFTLTGAYDPSYWQQMDEATFAREIVGCWYLGNYKITSVDNGYVMGSAYYITMAPGPCTVAISFIREVF